MKRQKTALFTRLRKTVDSLIDAPQIADIQRRRQARLLAALLLIIIPLGGLSGSVQLLTVPGFLPTFLAILGALLILGVAYLLARTKYYLIAAAITSLTPFLASYAALWTNTQDQSAFVFMLISVLLSSILLNKWLTLSVAVVNILAILLLPLVQPAWAFSIMAGKLSFHIIISALILVAMWHRDLLELDRRREIAESELKFRSIFDNSVDAIGVSQNGVHVMVNPAYVKMFGCKSADSLRDRPIMDLIAPPERAKILEYVRLRANGMQVPSFYETRGLRCDGTEFDMEVHVSTYELGGEMYTVPILRDITERKQAEEALRQSEVRYRAVVESTTDLICRFLPDTTLTFVNESYCLYFGLSRDQLVGTQFLSLVPASDWDGIRRHVDMVIRGGKPVTYSHEVITPQGELRWQQWTDSAIMNDSGEVVELQSIGRDITEQMRAENSLKESERRFRAMFENVNLAGVILDEKGRITFINDFLLRLTAWTREEALGKDWFDHFLPVDVRETVRSVFMELIAHSRSMPHFENEILTRSGEKRLIRWNNTLLYDLNGKFAGTASIGEDVTEIKNTERSLRMSEEKFATAFRASPDVIVLTSMTDGRIIDANDSMFRLSGYSREEVVGRTTAELQFWSSPSDRERYVTALQQEGRARDLEVGFRLKSGEIRQTLLSGEIIELQDGRYILGVIRDVTERKKADEALRASEERYRLLFDVNPQPMWVYDLASLAFLAVNDEAVSKYGYSREEFLKMTIKDIRPGEDLPRLMDNIAHLSGGLDHAGYWRHRKKDGTIIDVEITSHTLRFEGREAELVLASDVTERKAAESALQASLLRQTALLDNIPDLAWLKDEENRFIAANEPFGRACGFLPADLVGKTDFDIWTEELAQGYRNDDLEVIGSGRRKHVEERLIDSTGRESWIETTKTPIFDVAGRVIGTAGIARDITERKQAEKQVAQLTRLYATLSQVNQAIVRARSNGELYRAICDIAIDHGRFSFAWIGLLDRESGTVTPVADAGGGDYLQKLNININDELTGQGPTGMAIRTGRLAINDDMRSNPKMLPWRAEADRYDYRSSVAIPFRLRGDVIGALNLYSTEPDFFSAPAELGLLEEISVDISFALDNLAAEAERRQTEESLRLSEERYRILAQNLPESALLLYDHDLRFILADGPELAATGYSKEMLEGRTLHETMPPDFVQLVEPNMRRALAGHTFTAELPFAEKIFHYSYVPIRHGSDNVIMAMILANNITQLKQAESALRDSQRRLSTAMRATRVGVWEWDLRSDDAYWSEENYRVLGLEPGSVEANYANWAKCIHPQDLPAAEARVADAIRERTELNIEFRVVWPDGSVHWVNDIGSLESDETGQPLGMYGIQMDITERKRAEEEREALIGELEAKNKESETLRESLASIVGTFEFSEIIQRVLDQIQRVIPFDSASVWRLDGSVQKFIIGRNMPADFNIEGIEFAIDETNSAFPILKGEVPYVLNGNVQSELPDFQEDPHTYINSWLAVPLKIKGNIIGLVELDGRRRDQFTDHHAKLAVAFANQVAIVLENAGLFLDLQSELEERQRLIAELELRNIESETLRESAASVALSLDLGETATRILEQLRRVVPYDSASVHLMKGNELEIISGLGFPEDRDPTGMRFVLDEEDPAYPILRDGLPFVLYPDVQLVSERFKDFFHSHIFSWMVIPLHARGKLIGMLAVDGFTVNKFTEAHARFALTFANQVAVTLENSRLYTELQWELAERQKAEKELRRREMILEAISASAGLLLKTSDWTTVIDGILERLGSTIRASHAYLLEAHPNRHGETVLSIRHEWVAPSFSGSLHDPLYHEISLHGPGSEHWRLVAQGQPFVGHVAGPVSKPPQPLDTPAARAVVHMPINIDGKWWGVIGFDDETNGLAWTNVEVDALQVAANVLSAAIQRQMYDVALKDELQQRVKLIEELEFKNGELERFAYTVSHDLKAPVVTIKGFLGFLKQDVMSGNIERFNSDVERIGNAAKKMEQLLMDLLELSRIGRLMNPSERIPFESLAREALEIVHGQLEMHGVTVHIQPGLPAVHGDRQRLTEVLQNLLDNSAKYMGDQKNPHIEIGLRGREGGWSIFFVRDNGIGIAPQHHERVFGLFNKLDVKSEGTGVGLALVKRIVEFHGGRIWVESEGEGHGTTVCFSLQTSPPVESREAGGS